MEQNNDTAKVTFEGEGISRSVQSFQAPKSGMAQFLIKYSGGIIKTEKTANYVLILFAAVVIIIASLLIFVGGDRQSIENNVIPGQIPGGI